jgi:hypothetical protein
MMMMYLYCLAFGVGGFIFGLGLGAWLITRHALEQMREFGDWHQRAVASYKALTDWLIKGRRCSK